MILDSRKDAAIGLARLDGDVVIADLPIDKSFADLESFRDRIRKALEPGPDARPTAKDLADFGINLFRFCFSGQLSQLYPKVKSGEAVRIQLLTNRSDLKAIPWEYMQEEQQAGSGPRRWRSIVRIVPSIGFEHAPVRLKNKIKVLFAASYSVDQQSMTWAKVKRDVEESLRPFTGSVDFGDPIIPANWASFKTAVKKFRPHVVHFCGHGAVTANGTQLFFTDAATNQSDPVDTEDLTKFLGGLGIQLVVLSACDTSAQPRTCARSSRTSPKRWC